MNSVLENRDKKYDAVDGSKPASILGHRLSSSSLLPSVNNNFSSSTNPESSHSNLISVSQEITQSKLSNTQSKDLPPTSQKFGNFTQTKKVGTTHFFPDNHKSSEQTRNVPLPCSAASSIATSSTR